ncbi:DNA ligase/mRNA capping enzyme [Ceraceosorus guamensis]|uniref:DNA ligase/mRNA capping enzyme n=1 Tax=Ceraceosorus guamensis TaxID=1522189 RepID=A0A316VR40_9BASI|nr:DNA ligase/mRNA capping enzyme [Ceraceosorus guamensis]PWN40129.1 DNA ligase/mRNA capping enzyme [Ceraceosorus guamensis]
MFSLTNRFASRLALSRPQTSSLASTYQAFLKRMVHFDIITAEVDGLAPKVLLQINEIKEVKGSGSSTYKLKRLSDHYSCSCPAWAFQGRGKAPNQRSCKHLKGLLGNEYELKRTDEGSSATAQAMTDAKKAAAKPSGRGKRKGTDTATSSSSADASSSKKRKVSQDEGDAVDGVDIGNGPIGADGKPFKGVMLANSWKLEGKKDPAGYWMSEKLDGVRGHWTGKAFVSRTGKPIDAPDSLKKRLPKDVQLDGELFRDRDAFDATSGHIRSGPGGDWSSISFLIFDVTGVDKPVEERWDMARKVAPDGEMLVDDVIKAKRSCVAFLGQVRCESKDHLVKWLRDVEAKGGEGVMLRQPGSAYKSSRSDALQKVKSFYDAEAIVVGHNKGTGRLANACGSLRLKMANGLEFDCGSGLTDSLRFAFKPEVGKIVVYRFQDLSMDGTPRFPTFHGEAFDKTEPKDADVRSTKLRAAKKASEQQQAGTPTESESESSAKKKTVRKSRKKE